MSDTTQTSDRCQQCGKEIPVLPVETAFCVKCRYHSPTPKTKGRKSEYEILLEDESSTLAFQNSPTPPEEAILCALEEIGASFPDRGLAAGVISAGLDTRGKNRGGLEIEPVLDWLMQSAAVAQIVGERAVMFAYLSKRCKHRPNNLRELGERLGCSHESARQKVDRLKVEFIEEFADLLSKP
jgi:hypothetical protein